MSHGRTLESYIEAVASAAPAPGGGSVAGVVGALAAALGQMVLNLTAVPDDPAAGVRHHDLLSALQVGQARLLQGAAADETAYQRYRDAAALPRDTPAAKSARKEAMQAALLAATEAPLAMAQEAAYLAALLVEVAQWGNRRLASDTALGALLAETTLRGALLNVRGNAALLKDADAAQRYRDAADRLETEGRQAVATALELASTR
ncbi:MAG: cyclodeaminase/cyclohydrolase family protein [Thermomicrobiales bacterium]|nr:cyclodeaminase/cyclohydrolase family protein [Thermomicrobiales bacterium]